MSNASDFIIENGELKKYVGHATSVTIPAGVEAIRCEAFFHNQEIEEVFIADSTWRISYFAFVECPNLNHVVIPKTVSMITHV